MTQPSHVAGLVDIRFDDGAAPAPDPDAAPEGFVVATRDGTRIHFLDWGGPPDAAAAAVLVPGLGRTAWDWAPVARRLIGRMRTVVMDPRGHGLSDAPHGDYDPTGFAEDVLAVVEGSGLDGAPAVVLGGHGLGAIIAIAAVSRGMPAPSALVLVDGGWERLPETTGHDLDEALRAIEEPPEVMRSMTALIADRRDWDPASWDADQERATREAVVETAAGRVVRAVRPHALEASLRAMYAHDPALLAGLDVPVTILAARDDDDGRRDSALRALGRSRANASRSPIRVARYAADGHNLLRYRPAEVAAAILSSTEDLP
ncbi:MAG TPA: alpha/beta hydrolase [Candidatus Limnocylindrales bacterium]|nr:alpha/beta hydrolase [Candidatus Limnocylindrales bacterium]